jgi:hypothetical protein
MPTINTKQTTTRGSRLGFEATLWATADRQSGNSDAAQDEGEPFDRKSKRLTVNLEEQFVEWAELERAVWPNMRGVGFEG